MRRLNILEEILECIEKLTMYLCVGFIFPLIGGVDPDIKVLATLTFLDVVSGMMKGIKNKNILSKSMFVGFILRKPAIYVAIMTMAQLDKSSIMHGVEFSLRTWMIYGCIVMESTSILENLVLLGIPIPKVIRDVLAVKGKEYGENPTS